MSFRSKQLSDTGREVDSFGVERLNLFIDLTVKVSLPSIRLVIVLGCPVKFSPHSHYSLCRQTTFALCKQTSAREERHCLCLPTHFSVHRKNWKACFTSVGCSTERRPLIKPKIKHINIYSWNYCYIVEIKQPSSIHYKRHSRQYGCHFKSKLSW